MEELLRTIFEAFPEKSTITFKGKCSDCGVAVTIDIIPTSEGFGLLGGAFVEYSTDKYAAKCPDCFKVSSKMIELYAAKPNMLPLFYKKDLLSSILSIN
ncbi:MAG: hypothetical protein WB792_00395 [Desulfobacterales bacterium]